MVSHVKDNRQLSQSESINDEVISPIEAAKEAGLRYVADTQPGIRRKLVNKHFRYIGTNGKSIQDEKTLERIRKIAIPPAWKDVWICASPRGHIQATGRDTKGRKQYRYHTDWRRVRDETKYDRLLQFGTSLPIIRARVEHDLALKGLPREKVLATIVRLLDTTSIRIGNETYARDNGSIGLTTMQSRNVAIAKDTLHFDFTGKGGKHHEISIHDRALARIVKKCHDLPGYELFQYLDEHQQLHAVDSEDVNEYLQQISGHAFTAKDFRTWIGSVIAAQTLSEMGTCETEKQGKKNVIAAVEKAAEQLGNTPAICRKSYVYPHIIDAYMDGSLCKAVEEHKRTTSDEELQSMTQAEITTLAFLDQEKG